MKSGWGMTVSKIGVESTVSLYGTGRESSYDTLLLFFSKHLITY